MTARAGRRLGHAEVFAGIFALGFLAARFLPLLELGLRCPFRAATGLPCATCGMTHAFVLLAHGRPGTALAASPLGALLAGGSWTFALLAAARVASGRPWPALPPRLVRAAVLLGGGALLANWAYLVVAHQP
jgi:hypothetical protein